MAKAATATSTANNFIECMGFSGRDHTSEKWPVTANGRRVWMSTNKVNFLPRRQKSDDFRDAHLPERLILHEPFRANARRDWDLLAHLLEPGDRVLRGRGVLVLLREVPQRR